MPKTCNNCGTEKTAATVPYVAHEFAMARAERQSKRLVAVIILLVLLLVGSNIGWLVYESSFEEITESYVIEQEGESGNNNSVINGGEITNG